MTVFVDRNGHEEPLKWSVRQDPTNWQAEGHSMQRDGELTRVLSPHGELVRQRAAKRASKHRFHVADPYGFRAQLRVASHSRDAMAVVLADTLRALGYDVSAWDGAQWTAVGYTPQLCSKCMVKLWLHVAIYSSC